MVRNKPEEGWGQDGLQGGEHSADLLRERVSKSQCGNKGRDWYTGSTWQTEDADGQKDNWLGPDVYGRQPRAGAVQTVRKGWFELRPNISMIGLGKIPFGRSRPCASRALTQPLSDLCHFDFAVD